MHFDVKLQLGEATDEGCQGFCTEQWVAWILMLLRMLACGLSL